MVQLSIRLRYPQELAIMDEIYETWAVARGLRIRRITSEPSKRDGLYSEFQTFLEMNSGSNSQPSVAVVATFVMDGTGMPSPVVVEVINPNKFDVGSHIFQSRKNKNDQFMNLTNIWDNCLTSIIVRENEFTHKQFQ